VQQELAELRAPRARDLAEGADAARQRSKALDAALVELTGSALGASPSLSVVAVGGYGRGELSPYSDVDLLILVGSREVTAATVRGLLYPLWDAGFEVGHAVRTPRDTIERATAELDTATAIFSARLVAGDESLFNELIDRRKRWISRDSRKLARRLADATQERHQRVERAGWLLAPDLKEDVGGLRDVHRLGWLQALGLERPRPTEVVQAEATLLGVREALHAEAGRRLDRIRIDLQAPVAEALGFAGEDAPTALMHQVHAAARAIEHHGSLFEREMLEAILGGPKRSGGLRRLSRFARVEDSALTMDPAAPRSVAGALDLLMQRAQMSRELAPHAVRWIDAIFASADPARWDDDTHVSFLHLLRGPHVVAALELLDHTGGWSALMPEWLQIRTLAQHDPYHRYTVDYHLFVAVGEIPKVIAEDPVAAVAAEEAGDLSPLYLAALLHDIGKGSGEDHSAAGERIAHAVTDRMGLSSDDRRLVATLVRQHLTLVDTATRRDLDDGAVIAATAEAVGDPRTLRLLYILSVADGRATGPEGWSEWKTALVRDLFKKTLVALETGKLPSRSDVRIKAEEIEAYEPGLAGRALDVLETLPPSYLASAHLPDMVDDVRLLLQTPHRGRLRYRLDEGAESGERALTLCVPDRPGALARTAGVLALHRLSVRSAQAFSTTEGIALQRFITTGGDELLWERVTEDLASAYSGRLALDARLDHKIQEYGHSPAEPDIRILQDVSEHSTVVEVRTTDAIGLLYGIAAALGDLDLDIHVAKIDTLGARVVDVFYVRDEWGSKLGAQQADEVRRAIRHRLSRLYPG
jgi:[protein-PII] uridylyltransferase